VVYDGFIAAEVCACVLLGFSVSYVESRDVRFTYDGLGLGLGIGARESFGLEFFLFLFVYAPGVPR